jgi:magnesium transporter
MFKEFRVAILTGLSLAVATFVKLMLVERLGTAVNGYMIALAICLSMFATVVIAKFIGCCMPLLAKKFRLDPAVIASPFISTIVDSVSLLIYCNIAIALLP